MSHLGKLLAFFGLFSLWLRDYLGEKDDTKQGNYVPVEIEPIIEAHGGLKLHENEREAQIDHHESREYAGEHVVGEGHNSSFALEHWSNASAGLSSGLGVESARQEH